MTSFLLQVRCINIVELKTREIITYGYSTEPATTNTCRSPRKATDVTAVPEYTYQQNHDVGRGVDPVPTTSMFKWRENGSGFKVIYQ